MSRAVILWLSVIIIEVIVAIVLIVPRLQRPQPPTTDEALLEPASASQLRELVRTCESAEDWRSLGEIYMTLGCYPEAEACHRIAVDLAPSDAELMRQWAFALERLGMLREANEAYEQAIALGHPNRDACRYFIGRNHLRAGEPERAQRAFEQGNRLPANRYELARLLENAGNTAQADAYLNDLAITNPRTLQPELLRYRLAIHQHDENRARKAADDARYANEKLPTPFDTEVMRLQTALQGVGSNRDWKRIRERINKLDYDEADRLLTEAMMQDRNAAVVELSAELAFRRRRWEDARAALIELEQMNGQSARITARIGDIAAAMGRDDEARTLWQRAITLGAGADLKALHHNLAASFARTNDVASANHHLARGHYFVGLDVLKLGHPDQAIAYFEAAIRHDRTFTSAYFYLGEANRRAGQPRPARAAYEECLKRQPNHGRVEQALALLPK